MKALHKTLDIIDFIAASGSAGIREISENTGFPPATAHRIASVLSQRKYLEQDPVTKTYCLSLKFLELGNLVQNRFDLTRIVRPYLELLVSDTGESASLIVRDGYEAVYLDHVQDDHMLQLFTRVGARLPLYSTGGGKIFLAALPENELESYLERVPRTRYTSGTLVQEGALRLDLADIRRQGYAMDNEEMAEGIRCVAAPVFHHDGRIAAAVSVSGASIRISTERLKDLGGIVRRRAGTISRVLGFDPEKQKGKGGKSWLK